MKTVTGNLEQDADDNVIFVPCGNGAWKFVDTNKGAVALNDNVFVRLLKVEEKKTASGIVLLSEFMQRSEFTKKETVEAEVICVCEDEKYLRNGDVVSIYKGMGYDLNVEELGGDCKVFKSSDYHAKVVGEDFIVHPNKVLIRMKKDDRENLFSKWITRNDGTKVQLITALEADSKHDIKATQLFVNVGEVLQVGAEVKGIEAGDMAILENTIDNDENCILKYEEYGDKLVVVTTESTYYQRDEIVEADRQRPTPLLLYRKGEIDRTTQMLGVIRNEVLYARHPYVFLNFNNDAEAEVITQRGIVYTEKREILEREVLAVDELSREKYLLEKGEKVLVFNDDIFDLSLGEGSFIQCVMDMDIVANVNLPNELKNYQDENDNYATAISDSAA